MIVIELLQGDEAGAKLFLNPGHILVVFVDVEGAS